MSTTDAPRTPSDRPAECTTPMATPSLSPAAEPEEKEKDIIIPSSQPSPPVSESESDEEDDEAAEEPVAAATAQRPTRSSTKRSVEPSKTRDLAPPRKKAKSEDEAEHLPTFEEMRASFDEFLQWVRMRSRAARSAMNSPLPITASRKSLPRKAKAAIQAKLTSRPPSPAGADEMETDQAAAQAAVKPNSEEDGGDEDDQEEEGDKEDEAQEMTTLTQA